MGYLYSALWLTAAVMMLVRYRKYSALFIPLSIYFVILSAWWAVNEIVKEDLLHGSPAWILRGITLLFIIICVVIRVIEKRKDDAGRSDN